MPREGSMRHPVLPRQGPMRAQVAAQGMPLKGPKRGQSRGLALGGSLGCIVGILARFQRFSGGYPWGYGLRNLRDIRQNRNPYPRDSHQLAVGIPAACPGNPRGIPVGLPWKSQRDCRSFAVEFHKDSCQFSDQESHWRRPSAARGVSGKESGGRAGGEAREPQSGLPTQNPAALY